MIFLPAWNNSYLLRSDVLHLVSIKENVVIANVGETCMLLSYVW